MKMSPELLTRFRMAIKAHMPADAHKSMRKRWDALWASEESHELCRSAYDDEGLNDDHIDTALKRIACDVAESE